MNNWMEGTQRAEGWSWPVDLAAFDRTENLSGTEKEALAATVRGIDAGTKAYVRHELPKLERLLIPICRVFEIMGTKQSVRSPARTALLREMLRRKKAYWAWDDQEWLEILRGESPDAPRRQVQERIRRPLIAVAYLLCGFDDLRAVQSSFVARTFCAKVFGKDRFDATWRSIHEELVSWGWGPAALETELPRVVSWMMLASRSPYIESLTIRQLEDIRDHQLLPSLKRPLVKVTRVLAARGHIPAPLKLKEVLPVRRTDR